MPLGIISEDQYKKEVELITKQEHDALVLSARGRVVDIKRGRNSAPETPSIIRQLAAEEAICGTSNADVAKMFGISEAAVSAYKNDALSCATYGSPDGELKQANDLLKSEVSDRAKAKLLLAIDSLTADKIVNSKAKDISGIAKDMSSVMVNMEPKNPLIQNNTQVVVYRPRMKDENEYESLVVNE